MVDVLDQLAAVLRQQPVMIWSEEALMLDQVAAVLRQQPVMVWPGEVHVLVIMRRHKASGLGPPTIVGLQMSPVPRDRDLVPHKEKKNMRMSDRSRCENRTADFFSLLATATSVPTASRTPPPARMNGLHSLVPYKPSQPPCLSPRNNRPTPRSPRPLPRQPPPPPSRHPAAEPTAAAAAAATATLTGATPP